MPADNPIYRVVFVNQDKVYELYVRHVYPSDMWGFIQLEGFVFGSKSELVVDPAEEKLKQQFAEVKRSYVPMHAIIRIDEVQQEGTPRISDAKGTVTAFPSMPPRRD
ncbi:MAG: DUF1820 domain-containing protein [Oceanospirillaceae bacterium]|jgi:hypothetical protein|uniref:DUF1820 family protein n=1 Tax=Marinobacterium litorale TaxID=404770 RepID=UPI0004143F33|nr:DUF1820 family protein [Marinobacterium litorale]MBS98179.1 DUF1820 domain-containing protein [Oceanospirillaceae bacterium]